jgi:hypothetical protein
VQKRIEPSQPTVFNKDFKVRDGIDAGESTHAVDNNPMTVNSYSTNRASNAILSNWRTGFNKPFGCYLANAPQFIFWFQTNSHFVLVLLRAVRFARSMDGHSDIDYMVVFAEGAIPSNLPQPPSGLRRCLLLIVRHQAALTDNRWNSTTSNLTLCPHLPTCGGTRFQMEQARGKYKPQ